MGKNLMGKNHMNRKLVFGIFRIGSGLFLVKGLILLMVMILNPGLSFAGELEEIFSQVENLKIERQGYVLGAELTPGQLEIAAKNPLEAVSEKVFKFQDKNLNIVADRKTNRTLIIYEQFEKIAQPRVQDLIGELFMAYEDPTIFAHDKVVYWAWGKKGKFTAEQFDIASEKKKKLAIIATVKLNSEIKIKEKIKDKIKPDDLGHVYYIISSNPLLRFFNDL
jgi:hypothetical protein